MVKMLEFRHKVDYYEFGEFQEIIKKYPFIHPNVDLSCIPDEAFMVMIYDRSVNRWNRALHKVVWVEFETYLVHGCIAVKYKNSIRSAAIITKQEVQK